MKFRTRTDHEFTPSEVIYPKTAPKYGKEFDSKTGREKVVVVGQTNFYERIQASAPDTLIYNVIDRLERSGQRYTDALLSVQGLVDTLSMPRSLLEAQEVRARTKQFFNSLPASIREEQYGNSFDTFLVKLDKQLRDKSIKTRDQIIAEQQAAKDVANLKE